MNNVDNTNPVPDTIGTPDGSEPMGIIQIAANRSVEAVRSIRMSDVMALGFIASGAEHALGRDNHLIKRGFGAAQIVVGVAFGSRS